MGVPLVIGMVANSPKTHRLKLHFMLGKIQRSRSILLQQELDRIPIPTLPSVSGARRPIYMRGVPLPALSVHAISARARNCPVRSPWCQAE